MTFGPELARAMRRHRDSIQKPKGQRAAVQIRRYYGTVTGYSGGVLTVQVGADTFTSKRLVSAYPSPVNGDTVAIDIQGGVPLVIGKVG